MEKNKKKENEKVSKRIVKMTDLEIEKLYNSPRTISARLIELHGKVVSLIEFINILNELEVKYFRVNYTKQLKGRGLNPAAFLNEYLILEISNFYTIVHSEKSINFPEPPKYWKKLKDFRDAIPAHADKNKYFKTYNDLKKFYNLMDEIGIQRILKDFHDYFIK